MMSDWWKDKYLYVMKEKWKGMKRNRKEIKAEANQILLMKKLKMKKTLYENKETFSKKSKRDS